MGFGGNLAQGFKVYPWTAMQSFYVFRCFLERGARMLTRQCWLLYLSDLGETWHRGSRCIPEQLCKVSPKSHCDFLCFWCFLRFGADMLTCQCWLLYLWDLGETWHRVSRCIPEQLCKVSPKSHCDFLCFSMFSWAGCSNVNSSVLTLVLVGFGGNLVQGFRVYPWTTVPSFPHIVLWFSMFFDVFLGWVLKC